MKTLDSQYNEEKEALYKAKEEAFQLLVWEYEHNGEVAYELGDWKEVAHWNDSVDEAVANMNYFTRLHRAELEKF